MSVKVSALSEEEQTNLILYVVHFNVHYRLLMERYEHLKRAYKPEMTIEFGTYLDIILVQLRAMFIESSSYSKNYTSQILMRKLNENGIANEIDAYLDSEFNDTISIRNALKLVADKFICHNDNFEGSNLKLWKQQIQIVEQMRNIHIKPNIFTIVETLGTLIEKGFENPWETTT